MSDDHSSQDSETASSRPGPKELEGAHRARRGAFDVRALGKATALVVGTIGLLVAATTIAAEPGGGWLRLPEGLAIGLVAVAILRSRWTRIRPGDVGTRAATWVRRGRWAALALSVPILAFVALGATSKVHPSSPLFLSSRTNCGSAALPRQFSSAAPTAGQRLFGNLVAGLYTRVDCGQPIQNRQSLSIVGGLAGLGLLGFALWPPRRPTATGAERADQIASPIAATAQPTPGSLVPYPAALATGLIAVSVIIAITNQASTERDRTVALLPPTPSKPEPAPATSCGLQTTAPTAASIPGGATLGIRRQTTPAVPDALFVLSPASGSARPISSIRFLSYGWQPNGHQLAVTRGGPGATLDILSTAGQTTRRIPIPKNHFYFSPAWSPDETRLAVSDETNLVVLQADGTHPQVVGRHIGLALPGPTISWSPDGHHLAYLRDNDHVAVVTDDGKSARTISQTDAGANAPTWSPDGTSMAFAYQGSLWTAHADGTALRRLPTPRGCYDLRPSWSPDGRQIAFLSFVNTADGFFHDVKAVCILDLTTRARRQLTPFVAADDTPEWDPSATTIAFAQARDPASHSYSTTDATDIAIVSAAGSLTTDITKGAGIDHSPVWINPE